MKFIKVYLAVIGTLLVFGIGLSVYVWYTIQTIDTEIRETGMPVIPTVPEMTAS